MKTVSARQIKQLDRIAIEKIGLPSLALMENAGKAVAAEVIKSLRGKKYPRVVIFCGTGNNGGDGFVVGRYLVNAGIGTDVFLAGKARDLKPDAAVYYRILKKLGMPVREVRNPDPRMIDTIAKSDLLVDAVFGVGLNRELTGLPALIIEKMNQGGRPVLAVDVPSGLDATTGKIHGTCVRAAKTVTFTFAKRGFYLNDGPQHAGKIVVADIGIPRKLANALTR